MGSRRMHWAKTYHKLTQADAHDAKRQRAGRRLAIITRPM